MAVNTATTALRLGTRSLILEVLRNTPIIVALSVPPRRIQSGRSVGNVTPHELVVNEDRDRWDLFNVFLIKQ